MRGLGKLDVVDYVRVFEVMGVSYTERFGLSYEQWAELKARRILECLRVFYLNGAPLDLQVLAERVYRERLWRVSKESWMPVKDRFTDFRPSAFIKNFLGYLINRLVEDGYVAYGWTVEARDRVRMVDRGCDVLGARVYREGLKNIVIEVRDGVGVSDARVERGYAPAMARRVYNIVVVEARDSVYVRDRDPGVMVGAKPPEVSYVRRVLRLPSLDYLKDLCIWKPDPIG